MGKWITISSGKVPNITLNLNSPICYPLVEIIKGVVGLLLAMFKT